MLPEYDIVFAAGRTAIAAMASGCAALPISPAAFFDRVELDNFDLFQSQNFSPRLNTVQFNAKSIIRAISPYDPGRVKAVTAAVRSKCTLDAAADALESLYAKTIKGFSDQSRLPSDRFTNELHAMANNIQSIMPMVRDRERLLVENHDIQQAVAVKEQTTQRSMDAIQCE
ncbi:MAG: hypothetical protein ABIW02_02095 [Nitrosospira sp.]